MPEAEPVRKVIVIERGDLDAVREHSAALNVEVQELAYNGFEPVTTIALILIGTALAVSAAEHFIDSRKGGQVIDLRPGAPKSFYRSPDIVYGLVIILAVDGTVTVEVREPKGSFGMIIEALRQITADLAEATIEVVGEVLRASLTEGVVISEQPRDAEPGQVSEGRP